MYFMTLPCDIRSISYLQVHTYNSIPYRPFLLGKDCADLHNTFNLILPQQEDLGPLEMKISGLQKQISDSMEQCSQMQQHWLRQQRELVKKTQSLDEQTQAIATLQKEELILTQKKLRLDGKTKQPGEREKERQRQRQREREREREKERAYREDNVYAILLEQ